MELTILFRIRGKDGAVRVEYAVKEGPRRRGHTLLG